MTRNILLHVTRYKIIKMTKHNGFIGVKINNELTKTKKDKYFNKILLTRRACAFKINLGTISSIYVIAILFFLSYFF